MLCGPAPGSRGPGSCSRGSCPAARPQLRDPRAKHAVIVTARGTRRAAARITVVARRVRPAAEPPRGRRRARAARGNGSAGGPRARTTRQMGSWHRCCVSTRAARSGARPDTALTSTNALLQLNQAEHRLEERTRERDAARRHYAGGIPAQQKRQVFWVHVPAPRCARKRACRVPTPRRAARNRCRTARFWPDPRGSRRGGWQTETETGAAIAEGSSGDAVQREQGSRGPDSAGRGQKPGITPSHTACSASHHARPGADAMHGRAAPGECS